MRIRRFNEDIQLDDIQGQIEIDNVKHNNLLFNDKDITWLNNLLDNKYPFLSNARQGYAKRDKDNLTLFYFISHVPEEVDNGLLIFLTETSDGEYDVEYSYVSEGEGEPVIKKGLNLEQLHDLIEDIYSNAKLIDKEWKESKGYGIFPKLSVSPILNSKVYKFKDFNNIK